MKFVLVLLAVSVVFAQDFFVDHEPVVYPGGVSTEKVGNAIRLSFSSELIDTLSDTPTVEEFPLPHPFYETVTIEWNPQGHPPLDVWTYPHFDFHFYTMDAAGRARAQCTTFPPCAVDATSAALFADINPLYYPEDFSVDLGSAVPNMGIHAEWELDPQLISDNPPEWKGATFIYGFIDGEVSFLEPMVTLSLIASKETFVREVQQPVVYPATGEYPTEYRIYWDNESERHVIELGGLVQRTKGEVCCQDSSPAVAMVLPLLLIVIGALL